MPAATAVTVRPDFTTERLDRLMEIDRDHFWFRGRRDLVERLISSHLAAADRDLLDLGSGSGAFSQRLAARGYRMIALDFLNGGLRRLRAQSPAVRAVQSSGEQLPLGDACCDAALALDVLEHLDDQAAVAELHRVLRPGGRLIVTVPAFRWLWSYRDEAAGHRRRYDRQSLGRLLAAAGFAIEESGYYQCLLFPLAMATRWLGRRTSTTRDLEDQPPALVNTLFTAINRCEVAAGTWCPWPFGSSVYAVARKESARCNRSI